MIDTTEISDGIFRISMWDEKDLVEAGIFWPGVSYNMFLVRDRKPAIIERAPGWACSAWGCF
jgi:hypothetical protein